MSVESLQSAGEAGLKSELTMKTRTKNKASEPPSVTLRLAGLVGERCELEGGCGGLEG